MYKNVSPKELKAKVVEYFKGCQERYQEKGVTRMDKIRHYPSIAKMCLAVGITIADFKNMQRTKDEEYRNITEEALTWYTACTDEMVTMGAMSATLKKMYDETIMGYSDKKEEKETIFNFYMQPADKDKTDKLKKDIEESIQTEKAKVATK